MKLLVPLFILVYIFSVLKLGESLRQYMTYFLIGFLVLEREKILENRNRTILWPKFIKKYPAVEFYTTGYLLFW